MVKGIKRLPRGENKVVKETIVVVFILLIVVAICLVIKRTQKSRCTEISQENSEDENFVKSLEDSEKGIIDKLDEKHYFYKLGVCSGERVLGVCEFDSFAAMIRYAVHTNRDYGGDMYRCHFVIQVFKDDSYDFESSCFSQNEWSVNFIRFYIEAIAKAILNDSERGK